ncbi:phage head-tail joining protein [Methylorubrum extorquens]
MPDDLAAQIAKKKGQLAQLRSVKASGVVRTEANGDSVTYQPAADLRRAESDLLREISELEAQAGGNLSRRRTRQVVMTGRSGW